MSSVAPNKKQTLLMAKKYALYLGTFPTPKDKLSNKFNLLDDLNSKDKAMMKELRHYMRLRDDGISL